MSDDSFYLFSQFLYAYLSENTSIFLFVLVVGTESVPQHRVNQRRLNTIIGLGEVFLRL